MSEQDLKAQLVLELHLLTPKRLFGVLGGVSITQTKVKHESVLQEVRMVTRNLESSFCLALKVLEGMQREQLNGTSALKKSRRASRNL